jgi:hypothetical protein
VIQAVNQGQALRVLQNLDAAGRSRTAAVSAPKGMSPCLTKGLWEVLSASQSRFERLTQLKPPPLPGDIYFI